MKKLLSVLLAVMMLFGAIAMSASAANFDMNYATAASALRSEVNLGENGQFGKVAGQWVLVYFHTGNFTTKSHVAMYDGDAGAVVVQNPGHKGNFWVIPDDETSRQYIGGSVDLPLMSDVAPNSFDGWKCRRTGATYVAGTAAPITLDMVNDNGIVEFEPMASLAEAEEDTMGTILGILIKVFGSIVGLLFCNGDVTAGQELVSGVLGGIAG